jgi:GT2 family glycosyltransferase
MTLWNLFCRASGLTAISRNHRFFSEGYGGWDMNDVRPVEIVTGCFLLIPRNLWEKLGGFDPSYFMYGEEADLCLRATTQYGATPHFTPDATIIHYGGASEPVRADKLVRLFKAKITLVRRHFRAWERPVGKRLLTIIPLSRYSVLSAVASVTGHQAAHASAKVWGEVWARRAEWRHEKQDE